MAQNPSLLELLGALDVQPGAPSDGAFCVHAIPGAGRNYVGRNDQGQPCVLLGSSSGPMQVPIRLAVIEVRFGATCQIRLTDAPTRWETLTVVVCTASDPHAQSYFLHVCETIIRILGPAPSLRQVVEGVQRLVELFRRLAKPASRSVIGLLGELFLIARCRDIHTTVYAWRSADADRFDFSVSDARLDVKASGDRTRIHHFSAEQCQPPPGTYGLLVSIFIESNGGGMSLQELIAHIEKRLSGHNNLILQVLETVAETLGETLTTSLSMRFDDQLARSSMQVYDLRMVPAVRDGIPAEVSQVQFRSDLSRVAPLDIGDVEAFTRAGRGLLP